MPVTAQDVWKDLAMLGCPPSGMFGMAVTPLDVVVESMLQPNFDPQASDGEGIDAARLLESLWSLTK